MLRFRPIAPKPAIAGSAPTETAGLQRRNGVVPVNGKRMKRRYVRVHRLRRQKKKQIGSATPSPEKSAVESQFSPEKRVPVTLQLLPIDNYNSSTNNNNNNNNNSNNCVMVKESSRSVDESWVIVECVTEISTEFNELGFSDDMDKINSLEVDRCPGFISDGRNNVVWVNEAYKKMVGSFKEVGGPNNNNGMMVRLVPKEKLPSTACSCRVRLVQQTRRGQKWNRMFHCDVWRMVKFGGFAWRLDLDTSIGLGRC